MKLSWQVPGAAMNLDHVAVTVEPKDLGATRCWAYRVEQELDRGGLASPVRTDESKDRAGLNGDGEIKYRRDGAVSFGQPHRLDRRMGHNSLFET